MTNDTSRKQFLAKVLGLATVGMIAPGAVAKAIVPQKGGKAAGKQVAFRLQPQDRAIARREGPA